MTPATQRMRVPGLRASVALALVVFLVAVGASTGYAAWTAGATKSASVTAARAATTSTGVADLAATYRPGFLTLAPANLSDTAAVTVNNTGTSPLAYALTSSGGDAALNAQTTLQVWRSAGTCVAATTPAANATSGTLAAPPALPVDAASAAAGASLSLCLRTTLTGTYPSGPVLATAPVITVVGSVGDNWSAQVATTVTQTAGFNWFELRHKTSNKCLDVSGGGAAAVGGSIIIYTCKSPQAATGNQSFRFALDAATGAYRVFPGSAATTGPVWEPATATTGAALRLDAIDTNATTKLSQEWTVAAFGGTGEYRVVNRATGFCLTSLTSTEAAQVTVATCGTSTSTLNATFLAQRFTLAEIAS
jgi:hypothetical protein